MLKRNPKLPAVHLNSPRYLKLLSQCNNRSAHTRERALFDWSKKLGRTAEATLHASLLGRSGLHPRLIELPMDIFRVIWGFLNVATLDLCECLIIEAILINYQIAGPLDRLQQPEALRQETIKQWQLTQIKNDTDPTNIDIEKQKNITLEQEKLKIEKEKETLVATKKEIVQHLKSTITKIVETMSDKNEAELRIAMQFASDNSKEELTSHLLKQLYGCYLLCSITYKDMQKSSVQSYQNEQLEGIKRLKFVETHCSHWVGSHAASEKIKVRYSNTIRNAHLQLFEKCKPPHPLLRPQEKKLAPIAKKMGCVIS